MKLQISEPQIAPRIETTRDEDLLLDKPWHVVLLDDNQHTYDYVIEMLAKLFGYSLEKAVGMAIEVDTRKRVIVKTCHLELAEFHQERIHNYGPDPLIPSCRGSMSAVLERAL
jgi:ATP-dependent Clp protease adaptor protein ClpS